MINAALAILDRLIHLANIRKEDRSAYFDAVIDPLYRDVEVVVNDYVSLFRELIRRLETKEELSAIVKWLDMRRHDFLPLRAKVRENLARLPEVRGGATEEDLLIKGIWGVLKGGLSLTEEGHARLREYGFSDHTVLDLLRRLSDDALASKRERCIEYARRQRTCVEAAWVDASKGYFEHRNRWKFNGRATSR